MSLFHFAAHLACTGISIAAEAVKDHADTLSDATGLNETLISFSAEAVSLAAQAAAKLTE